MKQLLVGIVLILLTACSPIQTVAGPGEAIDPVCAYCRDMACIVVPIMKDTPSTEYRGRTYYFCSDSCRDSFLKNPEKYLSKPKE